MSSIAPAGDTIARCTVWLESGTFRYLSSCGLSWTLTRELRRMRRASALVESFCAQLTILWLAVCGIIRDGCLEEDARWRGVSGKPFSRMCVKSVRLRARLRVILLVQLIVIALLLFLAFSKRTTLELELPASPHTHAQVAEHGACPAGAPLPGDSSLTERYLVYSPQFGLSNQLVALRNAVVWALLLNRTLAVPHLLGHTDAEVRVPHSEVFDIARAHRVSSPLQLIGMDELLLLPVRPKRVLVLAANTKHLSADDSYFDSIGVGWHRSEFGAPLPVRLTDFTPASITSAFGPCSTHAVLAFRSLFATLDIPSPSHYPPPGLQWLNHRLMPSLLAPTPNLETLVASIAARLKLAAGGRAGEAASTGFGCAHIRRGDFDKDCALYVSEAQKPHTARPWVLSHFRRGWSCYQTNDDLRLNLQKLDGQRTYASVENHTVLTSSVLTPFALTSLSDYAPLVQNAQLRIPTPLASALIDQLVCSRASTLLLNGFSTFSQLVMGHIGLRHPELIGWTRDLSDAQQRQLKIRVLFWSRADFLRKRA